MKQLLLFMLFGIALFVIACQDTAADATAATASTTPDTTQAAATFADAKYTEMGKAHWAAYAAGDMTTWVGNFADNAVYTWNNGDSLAGKQAISDYYVKRRMEMTDTITFTDGIFLPVNVHKSQAGEETGTWLLAWYRVDVTYKNGKNMTQWMHWASHYNSVDKIDRVIMYRDNEPILAALK